jgi:hypothetical protein
LITLVAHDGNHVVGVQFACSRHNVPDEFTTGQTVQNFGLGGLHSRALAGGENNDGECVFGHTAILP